MRRASAMLVVAALAVFGLAACGGGGDNSDTTAAATAPAATATTGGAAGGSSTVDISTPAGSSLAYNQKDVSANAGTVTIDFDNVQAQEHDVAVEDSSGQQIGATDLIASGTSTASVDVTAGTYTFFCTVPGHREAGMEGTLTVK